ncbi:MAG: hypothetical protein CSB24_05390 [Deltaproteobacteria bacterium]|nr:MAG: hypothetical protein CSB24_05390 [Deltaproteobacteria bacterium]
MKKKFVAALAVGMLTGAGANVGLAAQDAEIDQIKQRINQLDYENQQLIKRLSEIDREMRSGENEAAEPEAEEEEGVSLGDYLTISGAVEVEFTAGDDFEGESSNSVDLATADFGLEAAVTGWASGTMAITWNGDDDKFELDEAFITIANPDVSPLSFQAGRFVVPFGAFETNTLSDPLTKEIFETKEDNVMLGFEAGGFQAGFYVFNGDTNEGGGSESIEHFGLNAGYAYESDAVSFGFGIGYINSAIDSDGLTELMEGEAEEIEAGVYSADENSSLLNADYASGLAVNANAAFGPVVLIGEYVTLLEDYEMDFVFEGMPGHYAAKYSAWQLEAAYILEIGEHETVFALNYSSSDDLGGAFPESRLAAAVTVGLMEGLSLGGEYCHDEDYSVEEEGTDESADLFTLRLAYEF